MQDTLAAVRGGGDDRDGLAVLQAAGRRVEGDDRGDGAVGEPRREQDAHRAVHAGEGLDGDVGDAEEDAGRGAEHDAVVVVRARRGAGPR